MKNMPVLKFECSGWCEELGVSYYKGDYQPRTDEEYKGLKKYAVSERVIGQPVITKALKKMTVKELRSVAAPLSIKNYAKISKAALIEEINKANEPEEVEEPEEAPEAPEEGFDDFNIEAAE